MALTLDSTLQTAQDGSNHRPICDLTVSKSVEDYPLTGNYLTHDNDQDCSQPLLLSDGRLAIVHSGVGWNGDNKGLRVVFSDTEQTTFDAFVAVDDETYEVIENLDAIVLDGSDTIGVICTRRNSSDLDIQSYKVSSTGTKLADNLVSDSDTSYFSSGVAALKKGTDDFACFWPEATDGTNWYIYMAASTDFSTWGSPAALSIGGLTSTDELKDPKIIKLADSSYMLFFSVADVDAGVYNLYYATSSDLSTWADAIAITSNTSLAKDYVQADLVQKSDGTLFASVLEQNTYLSMDKDTDGWEEGTTNGETLTPTDIWIDAVNQKLYLVSTYIGAGYTKSCKGVAKIDIPTWSIDKFYNYQTTPAVPEYFRDAAAKYYNQKGDGALAVIACSDGVCLIDFDSDAITPYYFEDLSATYGAGAAKNVNYDFPTDIYLPSSHADVVWAQVDAANSRLYVALGSTYFYNHEFIVGYIDLTDTTAPYDFNVLVDDRNNLDGSQFHVYPNDDLFVFTRANDSGYVALFDLAEGVLLKQYTRSSYSEFPYGGFYDAVYAGGKVWATVRWTSDYAADLYKKGLAEIDLDTDQIIYHETPWADAADNILGRIKAVGDELIISGTAGIKVFDITTTEWEYINNDNYPDVIPGADDWFCLDYDPTLDVFVGSPSQNEVYLVPRTGSANIVKHFAGEYTTSWGFSDLETMIYGYKAGKPAIALDGSDAVYTTWTDDTNSEAWIKWDKDSAELDCLKYLAGELSVTRSIDGSPNRLEFTLSHGHLFDPANTSSILNFYLQKGNKATLRLGETVSTVDYYANQGSFLISEISTVYQKGTYPQAKVIAYDRRCLWDAHEVDVSALSETYPEDAIKSLVTAEMGDTTDDYDLPTFSGRFSFDAQWIDTRLKDIVEQIANRFGYFLTMDVDDKLTARLISDSNSVDHAYTDTAQVVNFTPDDTFSDFVNRIVVTGESLNYTEVLYNEERITGLSGTVGWWGFKKDKKVWYSDDKTRRVRFPRLEVLESTSSILFQLAGDVSEGIEEIDADDQYCVVEISAPNLIPLLMSAIAGYLAAGQISDWVYVNVSVGVGKGWTFPLGRALENTAIVLALMVLGSSGNYQYELYGRPVGYVRRSVSGQADDTDLQQRIGTVVANKIEGFLCDTAARCTDVAELELMLATLQRSRAKLTKTAHLQDQEGDTITFPHPHTGNTVTMFVTDLKRRYLPTKDGHFLDEIEGWVL